MPLSDLPACREETAPSFLDDQPDELERYFEDLHTLFNRHNVADQQDRKEAACRYTSICTEQLWKTTSAWSDPAQSFDDFKTEVRKLYPGALGSQTHTLQELERTIVRYAHIGIQSSAELGEYYCQYLLITRYLIAQNSISAIEQLWYFFRGLSPALEVRVQECLQQKFVDHLPDDPYPLSDIFEAANYIIMSTAYMPFAPPQPPLPQILPIVAPAPIQTPVQVNALTAVMDDIAEQIKWTVQDQLASAATQTSAPGSSTCSFCGVAGHYMRECETVATFIRAGKCKRSAEGKIVLPTGAMAPRGAPGTLLRDRIEDWHQRNPSQAQMFYGIAGAPPGSPSRQRRPNSAERNTSQHNTAASARTYVQRPRSPPHPTPKPSTRPPHQPIQVCSVAAPQQQKDTPPHLAQYSVATEEHAEPPAQQEPSHIPIPTPRQVCAAAAESAQSTRAADTVSECILEAPVVVTQRELRVMAPDAWAQATSMSERAREEQPLFMMLEDILGDAYEPDASRTTAWSARLTQITDDYAVAALARSQPDALPPHIPSHSNPSQSDQPLPKLRQSTHVRPPSDTEESRPASSAKYEYISLSKVGARPIRLSSHTDICQNKPPLPEQQADEPRFALQNVATKPSHR